MNVYVLYRSLSNGMIDVFGIFSTKDNANNVLMDYKLIGADCNMKIKEVEMDKTVSF